MDVEVGFSIFHFDRISIDFTDLLLLILTFTSEGERDTVGSRLTAERDFSSSKRITNRDRAVRRSRSAWRLLYI